MVDILILDDDVHIRRILRIIFTAAGYSVAEADNGESGLAEVLMRPVRVVVADLHMPRMDGIAFARRLRTAPFTQIPHLIFMSASVPHRLIDVGQCATIIKPFDAADLLDIIVKLITAPEADHGLMERWAG